LHEAASHRIDAHDDHGGIEHGQQAAGSGSSLRLRNQPSRLLPTWFARLAGMALVVVASTTATARTSTPTAGTATAAAGSAGTAVGLGTRFVDIQCAAAKLFSIQSRDGFLGFCGIGHFYEGESARTAGVTVGDQADLIDFAMRLKQGPQFRFRGAVREIANKQFLHGFPFPVSQRKASGFSSAGFVDVASGYKARGQSKACFLAAQIEPVGSPSREGTGKLLGR